MGFAAASLRAQAALYLGLALFAILDFPGFIEAFGVGPASSWRDTPEVQFFMEGQWRRFPVYFAFAPLFLLLSMGAKDASLAMLACFAGKLAIASWWLPTNEVGFDVTQQFISFGVMIALNLAGFLTEPARAHGSAHPTARTLGAVIGIAWMLVAAQAVFDFEGMIVQWGVPEPAKILAKYPRHAMYTILQSIFGLGAMYVVASLRGSNTTTAFVGTIAAMESLASLFYLDQANTPIKMAYEGNPIAQYGQYPFILLGFAVVVASTLDEVKQKQN